MSEGNVTEQQKRARRRLVGAATLAAGAAALLPLVMDHEPADPAPDLEVSIPEQDGARPAKEIAGSAARPDVPLEVGEEVVDLPPVAVAPQPRPAPAPAVAPPAPPPEPAPAPRPAPTPAPRPEPKPAPRPAPTPAPKPEPKPAPKPAPTPAPRPEPKPAPAPAPRPAVNKNEEERVLAILQGRQAAAAPAPKPVATRPAGNESFVVQVGAFSDAGKANDIKGQLGGRGFAAYTERAGPVTRVRVGPFRSREEANQAAQRLRAMNMNAVVTSR